MSTYTSNPSYFTLPRSITHTYSPFYPLLHSLAHPTPHHSYILSVPPTSPPPVYSQYQRPIPLFSVTAENPPLTSIHPFTPRSSVVSVAPDESVLQEEREKVRKEYEAKMEQMKRDMMAEQESNALLQANMENLRKQYEDQINDIKVKEVQVSAYRCTFSVNTVHRCITENYTLYLKRR